MRSGLEREGLALARQGQLAEWPKLALARVQSESPLCTLMVRRKLLGVFDAAGRVASITGRLSEAPMRSWFGSAMLGFAARICGQR